MKGFQNGITLGGMKGKTLGGMTLGNLKNVGLQNKVAKKFAKFLQLS